MVEFLLLGAGISFGAAYAVQHYQTRKRYTELEVVNDNSLSFTPRGQLVLPPYLADELEEVMTNGSPSFWFGWWKRWHIKSQSKTLLSRANYINTIASALQVQNQVYKLAYENHHLRAKLEAETALTTARHDVELKTALLAHRLLELAEKNNLPLEVYLKRLDQDYELQVEQQKINQQLKKDEEQKRIEREHIEDDALKHMRVVSQAANAQAQLAASLHDQIDSLHSKITQLEGMKIPEKEKAQRIKNRKKQIRDLEVQLVRLEEGNRQTGPKAAPKTEAKADSDVSTNFGKVRTVASE